MSEQDRKYFDVSKVSLDSNGRVVISDDQLKAAEADLKIARAGGGDPWDTPYPNGDYCVAVNSNQCQGQSNIRCSNEWHCEGTKNGTDCNNDVFCQGSMNPPACANSSGVGCSPG